MATDIKQKKIGDLEAGQLKEFLSECGFQRVEEQKEIGNRTFVRGIKGIEKLFGVSHATAQRLKNSVLKDATYQQGRTILVDVEEALRLFGNKNDKS
ncbi:MAG: hypothetical protein JG771_258 [Methermicoccus sp.]|jgi:hypothetical protein|nr:hypothetical protein [Methermicoccus sp.]